MQFPNSPSPMIKFEDSPAESFLSAPGDFYTSLFGATTPTSTSAMLPTEMMTPRSFREAEMMGNLAPTSSAPATPAPEAPAPSTEKKPTKKRKSWGQVLPEPKTNLPPRKRAKTEDEKEQRRVERVLRNRRAAQSSRERKRLEVEALEKRNKELEALLQNAKEQNCALAARLRHYQRGSGVVTRSPSPLDALHDSVTLSKELFSSQDGLERSPGPSTSLMDAILLPNATVNPASISPALGPVADSAGSLAELPLKDAKAMEQTPASSPDVTQCSAATLCDLQCHMLAEKPQSSPAPLLAATNFTLAWFLSFQLVLISASTMLSACQRPLTQIALSLTANFSLLPTPQILTTILWLVTIRPAAKTQHPSSTSTSTSSTMTTSYQTLWERATKPLRTSESPSRCTTLRFKALQKILSSSPSLARPLLDATLVALRLVSEGCDDQAGILRHETEESRDFDRELTQCLRGIALPSKEVLMALRWTLKLEERKMRKQSGSNPDQVQQPDRKPQEKNDVDHNDGACGRRRSETLLSFIDIM